MARREAGPRRSDSVESYLRESRIAAAAALLALAAGVVSDLAAGGFWARHALLAGLASSVIIVMLSLALVNELVERRKRERWSVLAQYVLLQHG
jgi:membrane protein YdbS with pleckstrin-like domain